MSPAPVFVRIPGSHHPGIRLRLIPGFRDPGSVLILGQVTQYGNPYLICIINEIDIERVDEFDFLGLTINENMTWNSHIRKISNKISRVVGIMNRLKHVLPQSALKLMYDSLINSHLQFCTTACGYQCNRVTKLQKRALRIMCGAKYNAHTEPLLKDATY